MERKKKKTLRKQENRIQLNLYSMCEQISFELISATRVISRQPKDAHKLTHQTGRSKTKTIRFSHFILCFFFVRARPTQRHRTNRSLTLSQLNIYVDFFFLSSFTSPFIMIFVSLAFNFASTILCNHNEYWRRRRSTIRCHTLAKNNRPQNLKKNKNEAEKIEMILRCSEGNIECPSSTYSIEFNKQIWCNFSNSSELK